MNIKEQAINSVKWTSLAAGISMFAKLGQIVILTRFLSKEDFGLVAIALLFISFTDIFVDMGLPSALLHKQNVSKKEYSSLYWFNILIGGISFLLLLLLSPLISNYYGDERLTNIISILSVNILFSSISRLQRTFRQKKMHFKFIAKVDILASILMLILSISLAVIGLGVYSLVFSTVFNGAFIALIYSLYTIFYEKNIIFYCNYSDIKEFLKIGVYQVGSSILDYFSSEMDIIFLSSMYSLELVGVYSLCKQLALKIFGLINPIITKVLTPTFALIQNNQKLLKAKYLQITEILSLINFPIYFMLICSSAFVLNILYGTSYIEYSFILNVLCINYAFSSIGNPVGSLLVALGKTNVGFYWTMYRIVSTFIFLYIGSYFNMKIFILSILFINVANIYPEVKFIYEKLLNISYKEYLNSFYRPLCFSIILFPLSYLKVFIINDYLGVALISLSYFCGFVLLNCLFNKKQIKGLLLLLKLDQIAGLNYIYQRL